MNNRAFVRRTTALLADAGVRTWIFGGWAEELRGLRTPGKHADIDLLYPGETWAAVDALMARRGLDEVVAKRKPHKRAFVLGGVLVELVLVRGGDPERYSELDGRRFKWPADTLAPDGVASPTALADYRAVHRSPPAH